MKESPTNTWTQSQAIVLCAAVEALCPKFGCHVALTGGLLYKQGERKDCDLLFYRIRQVKSIDLEGLWGALEKIGLKQYAGFGWCFKATFEGRAVDMFFPEEEGGEYDGIQEADSIEEKISVAEAEYYTELEKLEKAIAEDESLFR